MKEIIRLFMSFLGFNPKSETPRELVTSINEKATSASVDATTIDIDGYRYFIESSFHKEGQASTNATKNSVFKYLSSLRLIRPVDKKLIGWLKNAAKITDVQVSKNGLCNFVRGFSAENNANPVYLATINIDTIFMIIAIEVMSHGKNARGLDHMACLIKAVSKYEKKHFGRQKPLNALNMMDDRRMTCRCLSEGNKNLYCFFVKY